MGYKLNLVNLQNVAPGNVAVLKCPAGPGAPTFDQICLELSGGLVPAKVEWVRGKANGRIFFDESTGTVANKRDDFKGVFTEAGRLVIDFTERNARNGAAEQLLASVPASLLQDLSFEIKLAGDANANSKIKATANYRPPTNNPYIKKQLSTTQSFAGAGTEGAPNIMFLPTGSSGGKMKRVWIREATAGNITWAQLRIANNIVHEVTRAQLESDQKRNKLVPQAGWVVLDFIEDGNLAGMLDTANAPGVELRLAMTAGDSLSVDYELIDPIARL